MNDKILKVKKSTLVDIADQVRAKTGSSDKIKVKDLDEAVANLQGGGCVEVDVLPAIMLEGPKEPVPSNQLVYDEEFGGSIPTDGPISCNRIVINTSLSIEETVAEIQKVTKNLDALYDHENCALSYGIVILNDQAFVKDGRDPYDYLVDDINMSCEGSDGLYKIYTQSFGEIFNSENGWDPIIKSGQQSLVINNDSEIYIVPYIVWNSDIDWSEYPNGYPDPINLNSEVTNLMYTASETLNPEVDVETIYKLPDETMWMAQDGEWCPFGKKYSLEQLGTYNNPEFGFYFGQVFGLDTPISIDISILNQKLVESGNTYYGFDNNGPSLWVPSHDSYGDYVGMSALPIGLNKNTDTGELSLELGSYSSYNKLNKVYPVNPTDVFTITIRQLYRDAYYEYNNNMPASAVDALLEAFPFKFGVVLPGTSYNGIPGSTIQPNPTNYNNLNLPGLEVFKCLKIGE